MLIYIDIDGTMTLAPNSKWGEPNWPVIEQVKRCIAEGNQVIVWSARGGKYATKFCQKYGIMAIHCLSKPQLIVDDNPDIRPRNRMPVILPAEFVEGTAWKPPHPVPAN